MASSVSEKTVGSFGGRPQVSPTVLTALFNPQGGGRPVVSAFFNCIDFRPRLSEPFKASHSGRGGTIYRNGEGYFLSLNTKKHDDSLAVLFIVTLFEIIENPFY